MNKPNFTPGPWKVLDNSWKYKSVVAERHIAELNLTYSFDVSEDNQDECEEIALANAKLIAAAPDMYAALEACHEAMAYMSEYDIPLTLPEQVKEALAEARGEHEH